MEAAEAHRARVELDRVANRLPRPETWLLVFSYGRGMKAPTSAGTWMHFPRRWGWPSSAHSVAVSAFRCT
jgi:hypothetical protein